MDNDKNPINPSDAVAGAPDVSATAGDENGGLTLNQINTLVGREYKSLEDAEKGLKETYSYVGDAPTLKKELEDTKAQLLEMTQPKKGKSEEVEELKQKVEQLTKATEVDNWFKENQKFAPHRDLILKLGDNPADVIADESNLALIERLNSAPVETPNTVMDSNSQPTPSKSYDEDFAKAKETGDFASLVMKHHMPEEEAA